MAPEPLVMIFSDMIKDKQRAEENSAEKLLCSISTSEIR